MSDKLKFYFIISLTVAISFLLSSCTFTDSIEPSLDKPKLNLINSANPNLLEVKISVITEENSQMYFKQNKVAFALTEQQYKNLALNVEELKSFIKKQIKIINLYKEYYELPVDSEVKK